MGEWVGGSGWEWVGVENTCMAAPRQGQRGVHIGDLDGTAGKRELNVKQSQLNSYN